MDDPNFGVTVRDPTTGQDVVLSEKDVATIKKLRGGKVPDGQYDLYTEWSDFYRLLLKGFTTYVTLNKDFELI